MDKTEQLALDVLESKGWQRTADRSIEPPALPPLALSVGEKVCIRTVTYHYLGRVVAVHPDCVILEDASWLADSGRFGECLANGSISEVEPYPDRVTIALGAVVDWCLWNHDLPREAK